MILLVNYSVCKYAFCEVCHSHGIAVWRGVKDYALLRPNASHFAKSKTVGKPGLALPWGLRKMEQKSIVIIGAGIAGLSAGCYGQMN